MKNGESKFGAIFDEQLGREKQRYKDHINTIKKYATRFEKDSASRILKEMDGNINYLKEMCK